MSPKKTNKREGWEVFSYDKDGKKVDAHLHNEILHAPGAGEAIDREYVGNLRKRGYSSKNVAWAEERMKEYLEHMGRSPAGTDAGNAMAMGRKLARGGVGSAPWNMRRASHPQGMIKSTVPGRTDKHPMDLPSGSYIVPADIPSALGEGNTMAGGQILDKMFKTGPGGTTSTGNVKAARPLAKYGPRLSVNPPRPRKTTFAEGGETEVVPIIAAGGEYVIYPESVQEIGNGDMKAGHRVLDQFVLNVRKQHIETLKKLKPPKK